MVAAISAIVVIAVTSIIGWATSAVDENVSQKHADQAQRSEDQRQLSQEANIEKSENGVDLDNANF